MKHREIFLKGNPGVHIFSDQISKAGFSTIDQNSDKKNTTKTPEYERIENFRHFELSDAKIGLETMEISYIMINTNNMSNIAIKIWFFENTRKSDVGKTTKTAAS